LSYIGNKPANKAIVASDLDPAVITGQTALTDSPASTDEFLISDAGTLKRLDASLIGGGKINQVVSTNKTDTFSESIATEAFSSIVTGLTVNITPSASSSKILVFVNMIVGANGEHATAVQLFRDSTQIDLADASSSRARFSKGRYFNYGGSDANAPLSLNFLDTPSSTSQITYGVKIGHTSGSAKTLYVNRSHNDLDDASYGRGTSTITVMEVLA